MRILVMFDLPVTTSAERKEYTRFRKYLIQSGFFMVQESIYCKMAPNPVLADAVVENVRKNKPETGLVQVLKVTEKQYSKMEFIVGESKIEVLSTDERMVVL